MRLLRGFSVGGKMENKQFWRDASGRLTFEMVDVLGDSYGAICGAVVSAFQLVPHADLLTNGVDVVFQDFRRGEQVVGFAWDNWTGFTAFAKTKASEPLVEEIAAWLVKSEWAASN